MTVRLGAVTVRDALTRSGVRNGSLVAAAAVIAVGVACRSGDARGGDRALLDFTLPLVVPLACFSVFESIHDRRKSSFLTEPLARHGADRHRLAFGATLGAAAACAVLGAALCLLALISASAPSTNTFQDLYACSWGGALVGAADAGLLALGSTWGRRGRIWILLGDWVFGSGSGALALPWVRGHARNLLGGEAVLATSPGFAAAALGLITALSIAAAARRGPD